jgi:alpha-L-fucosidase
MGIYYSLYEWYNPLWLSDKKRYVAEHMFPQFKTPSRTSSRASFSPTANGNSRAPTGVRPNSCLVFNESPVRDES